MGEIDACLCQLRKVKHGHCFQTAYRVLTEIHTFFLLLLYLFHLAVIHMIFLPPAYFFLAFRSSSLHRVEEDVSDTQTVEQSHASDHQVARGQERVTKLQQ